MYELYDPCTIMFFFRNKHIMVDLGTGEGLCDRTWWYMLVAQNDSLHGS
jgi:hypothetical protein